MSYSTVGGHIAGGLGPMMRNDSWMSHLGRGLHTSAAAPAEFHSQTVESVWWFEIRLDYCDLREDNQQARMLKSGRNCWIFFRRSMTKCNLALCCICTRSDYRLGLSTRSFTLRIVTHYTAGEPHWTIMMFMLSNAIESRLSGCHVPEIVRALLNHDIYRRSWVTLEGFTSYTYLTH